MLAYLSTMSDTGPQLSHLRESTKRRHVASVSGKSYGTSDPKDEDDDSVCSPNTKKMKNADAAKIRAASIKRSHSQLGYCAYVSMGYTRCSPHRKRS